MVPWLLFSFPYASFQLHRLSLLQNWEAPLLMRQHLSSLFSGLSRNIEILKRGFKGVFCSVSFDHLLGAFLLAVLHRELSLAAAHQAFL